MSSLPASYFDRLANRYDQTWTNSRIGRLQRDAVWRELDPYLRPGSHVLDLGCGTGEDALHLMSLGAMVEAIDASPAMVESARRRGVDAQVMRIEHIPALIPSRDRRERCLYDLILSNFGALNCISDLSALREPLASLLRPGGVLAVCVLNRFCLWETLYYGLSARFRKAARRWSGKTQTSSGMHVYYPRASRIEDAWKPEFRLIRDAGIGAGVPPSYVQGVPDAALEALDKFDRMASSHVGRWIADHRLLLFKRAGAEQ